MGVNSSAAGRWSPRFSRRLGSRSRLVVLGALAGLALGSSARGQVDATWLSAQSGSWFDATRWSTNPTAPNNDNPPGTLYRAIINATGASYDVTLASNLALSSLRLDSSNASVRHTGGIFDNLGTMDIVRGNWFLNGGTIRGGTLAFTNATSRLRLNNSAANTLDGVRLSGTTLLGDAGAYVAFRNGLTLNSNTVSIGGNLFRGEFVGSQSITGGTLRFNNPAGQTATLAVGAGSELTLQPGAAIEGAGDVTGAADSSLVNLGRLTIASSTRRLNVSVPTLANMATMEATLGGVLDISSSMTNSGVLRADGGVVRLASAFTNAGTMSALNGGAITFAGTIRADALGTATTASGGSLTVTGTLDNTSTNFHLNAAAPNWEFGGRIFNGTVSLADNRELVVASDGVTGLRAILDGTRVTTPAVVRGTNSATNPTVVLRNGGGFDSTVRFSNSGTIAFDRSGTFDVGAVTFVGNGSVNASSSTETVQAVLGATSSFTVMPGGTLSFGSSTPTGLPLPSITSRGTITGSGAGTMVRTPVANFRNEGLIDLSNGARLDLGEAAFSGVDPTRWSNAGTIRVRDGAVNLAGQFSGNDLATADFTGSVVTFRGVLNNTGSTLTLGGAGGRWQLGGGEVVGGAVQLVGDNPVTFVNGTGGTGSPNLILNGVAVNGNLQLGGRPSNTTPFGRVWIKGGLNLNGTVTGGGGSAVQFINSGVFSAGTIDMRGPGEGGDSPTGVFFGGDGTSTSGTLEIAAGVVIRGTQFAVSADNTPSFAGTIIHRGLISSDTPGGNIGLGGAVFRNEGIIEATNGGSISIGNGFVSAGTIRITRGGVLNIHGTNDLPSRLLPTTTWARGSGTVNLRGVLDNSGQVLTLDSSSGYIAARGGMVRGGEINIFSGGGFNLSGTGIGTGDSTYGLALFGTTVNGDLFQPENGAPIYMSDATMHGMVTLRGRASLRFQPTTGTSDTIRGGTFLLDPQTSGGFTDAVGIGMTSGLSLTLSPTTLVRGGGPSDKASIGTIFSTSQATTLINQGRLSADEAGQILLIRPNIFRNEGIVEAINGGVISFTSDTGHSSSNPSGFYRVSGGGQIRLGKMRLGDLGMYDANDGRITLAGMVDNTNNTFTLSPTGGSLYFGGPESRITGGTIVTSGSSWLKIEESFGWLTNTSIVGNVHVGDNGTILAMSSLGLDGTIHLAGSAARLQFGGAQTLNSGTISFEGTTGANRVIQTDSTLTLGAGVVVRGGRGTIFTSSNSVVVNNGRISADVAGQSISIYLARFTNNGIVEAINGGEILFVPPGIAPSVNEVFNAGVFSLVPGSRIDVGGSFEQSSTGVLQFAVTGEEEAVGSLWASVLSLGGTLRVTLSPTVVVDEGASFRFLHADEIRGRFDRLELPTLGGGLRWDVGSLYSTGAITVVPGPGVGLVVLAGIGALARRRRSIG